MKIRFPKKYISLATLLLFTTQLLAQKKEGLDEFFRTDDKFYVVVAVLTIVLVGLLAYVVIIDRKLSKIEKNLKNKNNPL